MSINDMFANGNTPNIVIFITDQERAVSEWPKGYRKKLASKLKAMQRLDAKGLHFNHAYTAACMCSPSRAAFQTSQYPYAIDCTQTGTAVLPLPGTAPNYTCANLATVLKSAGYKCYWIGKWHLLGPNEPPHKEAHSSLERWGYDHYAIPSGTKVAWDPPDAGINLSTTYLGGGAQGWQKGVNQHNRNDNRYVHNAMSFLKNPPQDHPWCLVVSLVNPHDVHLAYMGEDGLYYDQPKYADWKVPIPEDFNQSPTTMPRGQSYYSWANRGGNNATQDFANFYAFLMRRVDRQIGSILDVMDAEGLTDDTLVIRFADHGEMGLAHGLVEKFVNAYSQTMHVPLVFSNPNACPSPQTTDAIASTVDLVPTLASLLGKTSEFTTFVGADLSPVLADPSQSVQEYVHFTYDDWSDGSSPSVIRTIRSKDWVYSVYLQSATSAQGYTDADWEMYDLRKDPRELNNLAGLGLNHQMALDWLLQVQMKEKGTAPAWYPGNWPPQATACSRGGPPPAEDEMLATYPVGQVPGIGKAHAESLTYVGIADTDALLARCKTSEGRKMLAGMVAVSERKVGAWVEAAKLLRLPGLGPRQAKRLSAGGIRSLAELAKAKRKLNGLDKPDKQGHVIAPDKLASWVAVAQAMPPVP